MKYSSGIVLLCLFMVGCASSGPKKDPHAKRISELRKTIRAQAKEISNLHEKLLVIESLMANTSRRPPMRTRPQKAVTKKPAPRQSTSAQKTDAAQKTKSSVNKGEHFLYAKVIEQYRKSDIPGLERTVELFLKTFAKSVHADNALFYLGQKYLQKGMMKKAAATFSRQQKLYPLGNKYSASLLSQSLAYKALGKKKQSLQLLETVSKKFPGSREAFISETEISLFKVDRR